ncbi:SOS response-associated peptidase [Paracoccus seriniphilus]|uniref:Abasic site processing protein n=1 Tax=Paracoccus seriniphilus TaxID=184748 RepID=A0A239PUM2_9RHOB|nr:SOS response-associated peptidase [Paracoccus seriniphilus]WCR15505.1 SOS response-associated peptidase [Paracoccus seriniphilus]SNT74001.1 Putative SOS response-associated peptidase YedK [Paracoccus seriniphilus]
MCGRFVDPNLRGTELEHSELKIDPIARRFNVKPTQPVLTMGADGIAEYARWWLIPSWFKGNDPREWKATTFNARIEDAASKPSFRGAWKYGRCLIPAAGYYEWTGGKGNKQPHFIRSAGNEENLWFAGLKSLWHDLLTCTIVTRAANDCVAELHGRMPVVLNASEREAWLAGIPDPDIGAGARLTYHPVARFGIKDDGPELIETDEA